MIRNQTERTKGGAAWYLAMIKKGQERLAKENLERQGFEVYLPMHRPSMRTLRDGRLPAPRPFLPGYLFVSLDLVSAPWRKLLSTYGVRDVHMTGAGEARRPRAIPGRWIERLQAREDEHGLIVPDEPKAPAPFAKGERVLAHVCGVDVDALFCEPVDAKRVVILASLLGRESRVEVSLDRVSRGPVR
ncbi:transcription termination/antitermination NusG family protein [Brevundimonas sp.]|jgi:transcriptional antiterminator RfaH|uniref:transcription termination/antitermination NusG family protein n=1 Tax=Brevundimonas sp. TaxID=1871086 RepID=UPI0022C676A5|nr:transcription termination/antitermination NusG family protein [Brevundimonas sp.]MCZ8195021.1 hypothetical protein [Brevundimonas sp.]